MNAHTDSFTGEQPDDVAFYTGIDEPGILLRPLTYDGHDISNIADIDVPNG